MGLLKVFKSPEYVQVKWRNIAFPDNTANNIFFRIQSHLGEKLKLAI